MNAEQIVGYGVRYMVKHGVSSYHTARVIGCYAYPVLVGFEKVYATFRLVPGRTRQIEARTRGAVFHVRFRHRVDDGRRGAIEILRVVSRKRQHVAFIRSGAEAESFQMDPRRWLKVV